METETGRQRKPGTDRGHPFKLRQRMMVADRDRETGRG